VLAPEAERADAVVVGEDLGTTHRRPPRPVPSWPLPASSPTTCPSPRAGGRTWRCDGKPRGRSAATPADAVGDLRQPNLPGTNNGLPQLAAAAGRTHCQRPTGHDHLHRLHPDLNDSPRSTPAQLLCDQNPHKWPTPTWNVFKVPPSARYGPTAVPPCRRPNGACPASGERMISCFAPT
jgi:hypothetical protein